MVQAASPRTARPAHTDTLVGGLAHVTGLRKLDLIGALPRLMHAVLPDFIGQMCSFLFKMDVVGRLGVDTMHLVAARPMIE